jgi:hypothetical protein
MALKTVNGDGCIAVTTLAELPFGVDRKIRAVFVTRGVTLDTARQAVPLGADTPLLRKNKREMALAHDIGGLHASLALAFDDERLGRPTFSFSVD